MSTHSSGESARGENQAQPKLLKAELVDSEVLDAELFDAEMHDAPIVLEPATTAPQGFYWPPPGAPAVSWNAIGSRSTNWSTPPSITALPEVVDDSIARYLYYTRTVLVILGGVLLAGLCIGGWSAIAANQKHFDPEAWVASEGDQAAAKAKLAEVNEKVTLYQQRAASAKSLQPTSWDEVARSKQSGELQAILDRLPTTQLHEAELRCRELENCNKAPAYQERIRQKLVDCMRASSIDVGAMAIFVRQFGDDDLREQFWKSLSSAEEVRRRYTISLNSMEALINAFPRFEQRMLVRLALEMGDYSPSVEALLGSRPVAWGEHADLAFASSPQVRAYIRRRLTDQQLAEAAIRALKEDRQTALAAAEWWLTQTPDEERRGRVLSALEPCLAYSVDDRYPAAAAYVHWSGDAPLPPFVKAAIKREKPP
ncbi:MAG: hypothetical protein U0939_18895 [Pirellulales bacterium]